MNEHAWVRRSSPAQLVTIALYLLALAALRALRRAGQWLLAKVDRLG